MKTIAQARSWFRRRGMYDVLIERLHECGHTFERCFSEDPRGLINSGITWAQTPEGSDFWRHLYDEYTSWYDGRDITPQNSFKPKFNLKEKVIVKKELSSDIVGITEEMLELCGKTVTIVNVDTFGYMPEYKTQDGCLYYIKEDKEINSWTNKMFENKKL